jgi:S-adenosyl-L-methionine hydrolase (adenosine-forming)
VVIVTLLTDFGAADTYVGQMKGAILGVAPSVTLVDLTHVVAAQDVFGGAFLLWSAVETLAAGTVHLAVVDPGVGSPRRGVAARAARGDLFVGPDNGLLVPALARLGGCTLAVELNNPEFWRPRQARTFHGRDIFGPVAGHLAAGVALEALGSPIELQRPFELQLADGLSGVVLHVDGFGNLITNLRAERLPAEFDVVLNNRRIPRQAYYAAAQPGALLALIGSSGLLEISLRDGNAAAVLHARRGDPVRIEPV